MARVLTLNVFRYNPEDSDSVPHTDVFHMEETEGLTLFIALMRIREEQDPSLQFDFCCRAGICGSCAMVINGRPGLACKTLTKELPEQITHCVQCLPGILVASIGVCFLKHLP